MTQTSAPSSRPAGPKELRQRIKLAYDRIHAFLSEKGNDRLQGRWPEWEERLHDLHTRTGERPEVAISLVGGTGAGKSTLLNALIGARVLPVSNMRACTAAVCEVVYAPGPYRALVEFIPRESW